MDGDSASAPQLHIGSYFVFYDLGYGATGKVKLARHATTGQTVAMKIIKKSLFEKTAGLEAKVRREIALMRLFDHPHLLKLIEVCESPHHLYMIIEYAEHGELFDLLASAKAPPVPLAMKIFREIIYGVAYLHAHAICHRDLKPENILLNQFNDIKIGDFGFARWMPRNIAETGCGSPHYASPEVVRGIPYDGRAADIWSCGVILFALLAGRLPFHDSSIRKLLAKVKSGKYVMPDLPLDIQSLISAMLTVNPIERITIDGIKHHNAFHIGLSNPMYVLPSPVPLPLMTDPIELTSIDPTIFAVLRGIGFASDDELAAEFTMVGTSMAKVFYSMLLNTRSLDSYPWDDHELFEGPPSPLSDQFIVSPQQMFANVGEDAFGRRERPLSVSASSPHSLAERAEWADVCQREIKADLVQPCVGIALPLEVLMGKMQLLLSSLGFQWLHPDDFTIVARYTDRTMYLVVKVERETADAVDMNLYFTQAMQSVVQYVLESTKLALTSTD
jgi:BR serine/threonine kinase